MSSVTDTAEPAQPSFQTAPGSVEPPREPRPVEEFDYRPISPLAPVALFLGICSAASFLGVSILPIAAISLIVGLIGLRQIRRSDGELGGRGLAATGTTLSALFLVLGSGYHAWSYATELPEGYERVSFSWLAKQSQIFENGKLRFAPEVEALDGKKIYIKGYMYPTRQQTGIKEFVLVKDTGQCCFGGQPKLTDMVVVQFKDGMTVNHREQQLVGVAGTFHAGQVSQSGQLTAVYTLEGTHFR